jgi:peptide/nickel transport system permease protein
MTTLQAQPPAPVEALKPRRRNGNSSVWVALRSNRKALVGFIIFAVFCVLAAFPGWFTFYHDPNLTAQFDPKSAISGAHWLGTTTLGQDIYTQLIYGTRQSLIIAVVAGLATTVLSVIVGVTAAYVGGFVDEILSALTNVVLIIPALPLIIVLATYAGSSSLTVMLLVLTFTGWAYGANQMRAQALSLRNRDFLESARVRGERRSYIIVFEVLPTMTSLIVANFLGSALYSVLAASSLQFLGLGDNSSSSWGVMLHWAEGATALQTGLAQWMLAPGLCIALLGASFALMNYAFDEIGNPALRPVRGKARGRGRRAQ